MSAEQVEILILGSGQGGKLLAWHMARSGGLPYQRLREAVIAHMTIAEGLGPLLANVPPR